MLGPAPDSKQQGMHYVIDQPAPSWLVIRDSQGAVVAEMARGTSLELARQFAAAPDLLEAAKAALARMTADCFRMCGGRPGSDICGDVCCPVLADIQRLEAAVAKAEGRDEG